MKRKDSKLFSKTWSMEKIIVCKRWPCKVPNPVCRMTRDTRHQGHPPENGK